MTLRPTRRAVLTAALTAPLVTRSAVAQTPDEDPLVAALRAEHAAIWSYGAMAGAYSDDLRSRAFGIQAAHRLHRDLLTRLLTERDVDPPAAELTYALPLDPRTPAQALLAMERIEDALVRRWLDAVSATDDAARTSCALALADDATHLAVARYLRTRNLPTAGAAFPGLR